MGATKTQMSRDIIEESMATHAAAPPSDEELRQVYRCRGCGDLLIGTPLLQCSHGHILPIRCFWYRSGSRYYAECLDLDLITKGDTPEQAIAQLQEDMYWYVQTALSGDTRGLLPRPASRARWIRYYLHVAWCWVKSILTRRRHHRDHQIRSLGAIKLSQC